MPTKWSYCIFCAYYAPFSNHGAFQLFSLLNLFVGEPIVGLQGKGENLPEKNPKGPNITLHGVPGSIRVILDQSLGLENHIRAWYIPKTQLKYQLIGKCIRFKFFKMSGKGLRGASYSWWRCVIDNSGSSSWEDMFSTSERTYWWTTSFEWTNGGGEGEWNKLRSFYNETLDHLIDLLCSFCPNKQNSSDPLVPCNLLVCADSLVVEDIFFGLTCCEGFFWTHLLWRIFFGLTCCEGWTQEASTGLE